MTDLRNAAKAAALHSAKPAVRSASPRREAAPSPNGSVLPGAGAGGHRRASASIDPLCINTIRTLSMDAVQQADSGHPGTPMALAPVIFTLWWRFLRFDPADPIWPNRDRFVLSNGHASMLL